MIDRPLGRTGLRVSSLAFGAGPVSGLMTGTDTQLQLATVARAIELGVNWFDTAAGYGEGKSETNLGRTLNELGMADLVHVATKVRIPADAFGDVAGYVQRSVEASLERLRLPRVTLLQLHNGITSQRDDEPASVSVEDVLGPNGIAAALDRLRDDGLVGHVGLTGTGHPEALRQAIQSGAFDTLQVPYNALNPSAGQPGSADGETDYGNVLADCAAAGMGAFAIRVFAGGALLDCEPGSHTLKTPYFPLALYRRDRERAGKWREGIGKREPPAVRAVRFALAHRAVASAIVGFGSPEHVEEIAGVPFERP